MVFDPRLIRAFREQLEDRREVLQAGAQRVGWKLGLGERERIGSGPVVGYLTSASQLPRGGSYGPTADSLLHADAEVALELGHDGEVVGYGAALELVDLSGRQASEEIVAANVFHRAVTFGPIGPGCPAGLTCQLIVNDEVRAHAPVPDTDYARVVDQVARLLGAAGECLLAGDRLITGAVIQVPVAVGDHVVADLGRLGSAEAHITQAKPPNGEL